MHNKNTHEYVIVEIHLSQNTHQFSLLNSKQQNIFQLSKFLIYVYFISMDYKMYMYMNISPSSISDTL